MTSAVISERGPDVSFLLALRSPHVGTWEVRAESDMRTGNPAETASGERPVERSAPSPPAPHVREDQWLCGSERRDDFFLEPE